MRLMIQEVRRLFLQADAAIMPLYGEAIYVDA